MKKVLLYLSIIFCLLLVGGLLTIKTIKTKPAETGDEFILRQLQKEDETIVDFVVYYDEEISKIYFKNSDYIKWEFRIEAKTNVGTKKEYLAYIVMRDVEKPSVKNILSFEIIKQTNFQ